MLGVVHFDFLSLRRFTFRLAMGSAALLLAAAGFGCGRPFNVKTQPTLPSAGYVAKASLDEITVEALAITDEDFLYDTFDANLIAAGVLPVRVSLTNSGAAPAELKNARFEIETRSNRFKASDARKAFKRLISYYGISVYSKSGYRISGSIYFYALDNGDTARRHSVTPGAGIFLVPAEAARQQADAGDRQAESKTIGRSRGITNVELTSGSSTDILRLADLCVFARNSSSDTRNCKSDCAQRRKVRKDAKANKERRARRQKPVNVNWSAGNHHSIRERCVSGMRRTG
jgi:hypothetical protein